MSVKFILILALLIVSILSNLVIYLKLLRRDIDVSDDSKMQAQMILIDRKINNIKEEIEYIANNMTGGVQSSKEVVEVLEMDELTKYYKSDMKTSEIAKKLNKSVKEVELMLKLKGLV